MIIDSRKGHAHFCIERAFPLKTEDLSLPHEFQSKVLYLLKLHLLRGVEILQQDITSALPKS